MGFQIVSRLRKGGTASKTAKLRIMSDLKIIELSWREKGKRRSIPMSAEQVQEIAWLQQQIDKSQKDHQFELNEPTGKWSLSTGRAGPPKPSWRKIGD